MLEQAIAAQLNIDNGASEPNAVITEAVNWLENSQGATGILHDGILSSSEYSIKKGVITLSTSALSTSGTTGPWHTYTPFVSADGTVNADGEGIKNALMDWNDGHLVVSKGGAQVAWDPTGGGGSIPANLEFFHLNSTDEFWLTLHQAGTAAGAGIA
jgi:hypothetical protein